MGLAVRIVVHADEVEARDAAAAAFDRIAALDAMMSDHRPGSELRRLVPDAWTPASGELLDVVERAVAIAAATDGAFDPSIGPLVAVWRQARTSRRLPDRAAIDAARARTGWRRIEIDRGRGAVRIGEGMRLDLGGIAKGYILSEALRTLRGRGAGRALLEAGGDIVVGDPPPGRRGWHIDVPGADAAFRGRASALANAAIATSGPSAQFVEIDGRRYSHVIDPRTGVGLTTGHVARVIGADAADADALATAVTVLGPGHVARIERRFAVRVSLSREGVRTEAELNRPAAARTGALNRSTLCGGGI